MTDQLRYRVDDEGMIVIEVFGNYSGESFLLLLDSALRDPAAKLPALVLVDATGSMVKRTAEEVNEIAQGVSAWADRIQRMAIVTASDLHYGLSRMGSVYVESAGVESNAFRDYDGALAFLMRHRQSAESD